MTDSDWKSINAFWKALAGERTLENEKMIAQSPDVSFWYAEKVIKGRFPAGEPAIATSPFLSFLYAVDVIKERFPLGEPAIMREPFYAVAYAIKVIKGRWPEAEEVILGDAGVASGATYNYKTQILHEPAEPPQWYKKGEWHERE